jgi:hypothetical protein
MSVDYHLLVDPLGDDEMKRMSSNLMCLMAVMIRRFWAEKLDKKREVLPTAC